MNEITEIHGSAVPATASRTTCNSGALRVKRVTLGDEARTIKLEERKALQAYRKQHGDADGKLPADTLNIPDQQKFWCHRIHVVRPAARWAHLAHTFLTERPYAEVEARCVRTPDLAAVMKVAFQFGKDAGLDPIVLEARWVEWVLALQAHLLAHGGRVA